MTEASRVVLSVTADAKELLILKVCNVLTCIFRDTFSPGLKNKIILTKKQFWSHERLNSKILWTSNCKMSAVYVEKILGLNFLTKRKGTIWRESKLKLKIKSTNKNFLSLGSLFDSSKLNTTHAYTPSHGDLILLHLIGHLELAADVQYSFLGLRFCAFISCFVCIFGL